MGTPPGSPVGDGDTNGGILVVTNRGWGQTLWTGGWGRMKGHGDIPRVTNRGWGDVGTPPRSPMGYGDTTGDTWGHPLGMGTNPMDMGVGTTQGTRGRIWGHGGVPKVILGMGTPRDNPWRTGTAPGTSWGHRGDGAVGTGRPPMGDLSRRPPYVPPPPPHVPSPRVSLCPHTPPGPPPVSPFVSAPPPMHPHVLGVPTSFCVPPCPSVSLCVPPCPP